MKNLLLIITIVIIIGCGFILSRTQYFSNKNQDFVIQNQENKKESIIPLYQTFFNPKYFNSAIASAKKDSIKGAKAIIIPHHLIASEIIADILSETKKEGVNNIVIIGPNHEDNNATTITSAHVEWQTPLGQARTNYGLVDKFLSDLELHDYPAAFTREHSVGAVIPFVKNYYPQARILPILFNSTASLSDVQDVAGWLNNNLDENTLVIFSLDFSHYLEEREAKTKDEITKNLILSRDISRIINLDSDYVDSPATLATAMMYASYNNLETDIIEEKNSNYFSEQPSSETTSYFGIVFRK